MIRLEQITKTFLTKKNTITAVDNVQLTIENGDIYGVIGYSGAGKSTLIRMLNGLEKPTSGRIWISDRELTGLTGRDLRQQRQKIGMIFQHFHLLWSRTVLENILFPLEIAGVPADERKEKALQLIQLVGLEGKEEAYPAQLSGGQKQRVGIARALANEPDILLCDEATSALDPQTTEQILDLLQDINKRMGLTIILITHEMAVVRKICNKVAVMEDGKVVEEGPVTQVFRHPKQEITRKFVQQDAGLNQEETAPVFRELKQLYPEGKIVRLVFNEDTVRQPLLSRVSRECQVEINLIQGTIRSANKQPLGSLVVQLIGKEENIRHMLTKLAEQGAEAEEMDAGE